MISHNHYDHLDAPTLKRLPRDTPLFVPAGLGRWCRRRGFTRVTELDWWEARRTRRRPLRLRARAPLEPAPPHRHLPLAVGRLGADPTAGPRLYFAGDTGYGRWFAEIGRRYPDIDLALLPIGAYEPRWLLRPVHTDPDEAVQACLDLGARRMAPMHWATFLLSGEPPLEPLTRLRAAWAAAALPRAALWDLPVGGSRVLAP